MNFSRKFQVVRNAKYVFRIGSRPTYNINIIRMINMEINNFLMFVVSEVITNFKIYYL